jgi:cytochrome c oxidase subunit 2
LEHPRHHAPSRRHHAALIACAVAVALTASGCGGDQSPLAPVSRPAREISELWWWMLVAAGVVFGGAVAMLGIAWVRRNRPGLPVLGENEQATMALVVAFGILIPIVVLVALFIVANLVVLRDSDAPQARTTAMTVQVVGHQWFWEARYPGTTAVTANEIHIPARTPVNLVGTTADVIHSFWVPRLNRKIDLIPGRRNSVLLYADKPGRYRGQCAELCGLQHAHMGLMVIADPPARFRAWLAATAKPAAAPTTAQARRGEHVFLTNACAGCHAIRGTSAGGDVGPDLTHVASRATLAALAVPNRGALLSQFIRDPQHLKPGIRMPALHLSDPDFAALAAYLEGLR